MDGKPSYLWEKHGSFLVFHQKEWPLLAARELPESLLFAYQDKLTKQGRFTLDDVAAFSLAVGDRPSGVSLPDDLSAAGLRTAPYARRGLAIYASLSPAQLAEAKTEAGLPYAEMTIYQRQALAEMAHRASPEITGEQIEKASFTIKEEKRPFTREGKRWEYMMTTFSATFGDLPASEVVAIKQPVPDTTPAPAIPKPAS